jgi:Ca2+-binding EF-hand superfamily protein
MKRTLPLALAAAVAVAGAGLALAHDDGQATTAATDHHSSFLSMLDTNGDGVVDAQEWAAHFDQLDTNHDGKLTADELAAAEHFHGHMGNMPPEALAYFLARQADANHDGKVTLDEWHAFLQAKDTDHDGALSPAELRPDHGFGAEHVKTMTTLPPFAAHWDTNGDGKLSFDELDALFHAADKNGDGVLDRNDHPEHMHSSPERR